jgi:hypothetical protein
MNCRRWRRSGLPIIAATQALANTGESADDRFAVCRSGSTAEIANTDPSHRVDGCRLAQFTAGESLVDRALNSHMGGSFTLQIAAPSVTNGRRGGPPLRRE